MIRVFLTGGLIFTVGIGIAIVGFVYDIMFAGIPYQDAPAQLQASYALHSRIAAAIETVGLGIAVAALLTTLCVCARKQLRSGRRA